MNPPDFWLIREGRDAAFALRALLWPLSALYALGARWRRMRTTPVQPPIPVVCIGNLTLGGTGKTPLAQALRAQLSARGVRAACLSRGWKGSEPGPLQVDPAVHLAAQVGDEPLMLAASGQAWIARDRVAGVQAMAKAGVELVLLDDGHQNPSLVKARSIVVVDGQTGFGNGFVVPAGPLRETIREGLARADAIVVMGELTDEALPAHLAGFAGPIVHASLQAKGPAPPGRLVAFAGIGRPVKFFDGLKAAGAELIDAVPFPDHHAFTREELSNLRALAAHHGAQLITTQKDLARLSPEQAAGILTFPIEARFEQADALAQLLGPLWPASDLPGQPRERATD